MPLLVGVKPVNLKPVNVNIVNFIKLDLISTGCGVGYSNVRHSQRIIPQTWRPPLPPISKKYILKKNKKKKFPSVIWLKG